MLGASGAQVRGQCTARSGEACQGPLYLNLYQYLYLYLYLYLNLYLYLYMPPVLKPTLLCRLAQLHLLQLMNSTGPNVLPCTLQTYLHFGSMCNSMCTRT